VPYFDYNMMLSRFRAYLRKHKIQILDAEKTSLEWIDSRHLVRISTQPEAQGYASLRPNFAKSIVEISQRIDLHTLDKVVRNGGDERVVVVAVAVAPAEPDEADG